MIKKLLLIITIFVLTGCATTTPVTVIQTKNILVIPPDELMVKCTVEQPPLVSEYISSTWEKKEDLLVKHSIQQMKNLFKCNEQIKSLNEWKKKQQVLYPITLTK